MASRFASFTEEQILSINEAAVPKNTKNVRLKSLVLLRLSSFDHLPYRVTLCARERASRREISTFYCAHLLQYC